MKFLDSIYVTFIFSSLAKACLAFENFLRRTELVAMEKVMVMVKIKKMQCNP